MKNGINWVQGWILSSAFAEPDHATSAMALVSVELPEGSPYTALQKFTTSYEVANQWAAENLPTGWYPGCEDCKSFATGGKSMFFY